MRYLSRYLLRSDVNMKELGIKIKLAYVTGLREVVWRELESNSAFCVAGEEGDAVYLKFDAELLSGIKNLKSVARAYIVVRGDLYNPLYISTHKSVLGDLIDIVVKDKPENFRNFKLTCAGLDSPEVKNIIKYIEEKYKIPEKNEADLKIHIIKTEDMWEVGLHVTPRPLSVRDYKVVNMSGAMDSTIAYAVNSFGNLNSAKSYLNIFSGSGTLLIEAAKSYPKLEKIVGFDNDKNRLSLSIQNIKKAGLIKKVEVKEGNIFDKPEFGKFDVIASDLPFGMAILKNEDLESLYKTFIEYCEEKLKPRGRLVVYTSEVELLQSIIEKSKLKVIKTLDLKFMTASGAYLRPKILVCEYRAK